MNKYEYSLCYVNNETEKGWYLELMNGTGDTIFLPIKSAKVGKKLIKLLNKSQK